jgi:hypothetical protein
MQKTPERTDGRPPIAQQSWRALYLPAAEWEDVDVLEQRWRLVVSRPPARSFPDPGLRRTFDELADTWEAETAFVSVVMKKVLHPSYQRIIGLGPAAVPLILERLEQRPQHWFWALEAITGDDPADGADSTLSATDAWLDWGRERGLV